MKLVILVLVIFSSLVLSAQAKPGSASAVKTLAAKDGLETFKKLVSTDIDFQDNVVLLHKKLIINDTKIKNSDTSDDFDHKKSSFKLGRPISIGLIRIDSLSNYRKDKPISNLFYRGNQAIYPVLDEKGHQISTITIEKKGYSWSAEQFGRDINLVQEALNYSSKDSSINVLKIPSLHVNFINFFKFGKNYLVPLQNDRKKEFQKGKEYLAEDVLLKYVSDANKYNGAPR